MNNCLIKNKAFTLIEIMFVISIITFLSTSGVIYFNNFIDSKKIDKDLTYIDNSIENFNNTIKEKQNLDYEITFTKNQNYLTYKMNQTLKKIETNIFIDNNTKTYSINTNFLNPGFWEIKIYNDNKLYYQGLLDQRDTLTGSISYQKYEFISKHEGGEDIFGINYFNEDFTNNLGNDVFFIEANTKKDKSGLSTNNFILKNINSVYYFYSGSTLWRTNEIYLFFEKQGYENSIKIIK